MISTLGLFILTISAIIFATTDVFPEPAPPCIKIKFSRIVLLSRYFIAFSSKSLSGTVFAIPFTIALNTSGLSANATPN
jgi:hypothetical protein